MVFWHDAHAGSQARVLPNSLSPVMPGRDGDSKDLKPFTFDCLYGPRLGTARIWRTRNVPVS